MMKCTQIKIDSSLCEGAWLAKPLQMWIVPGLFHRDISPLEAGKNICYPVAYE